ncbi:MAG: hypothetical protein ACI857_001447 [Arenicella sp.]|jgi:hypothetical protein
MASKAVQLDTFNFFLIGVSLIAAIYFPFELFILAYAILGPLHYITEINWLDKKGYFIKQKNHAWLLVFLTAIIAIPYMVWELASLKDVADKTHWLYHVRSAAASFALTSVVVAVTLVFTKNWKVILLSVVIAFTFGLFLEDFMLFAVIIGGLLPTIVHVFLFTILFMLYGAMKNKSSVGYATVLLMLIVPIIIYYLPIEPRGYHVDSYFSESFNTSKLYNINWSIGWITGEFQKNPGYEMVSEIGIRIQIFIAFAYTYHYLNWFSKTTVIGWHKIISKKKLILILAIWVVSISIYFYNYLIGFLILLFLSYLHVLMEFPLNVHSVKEIWKGIFRVSKKEK